MKWRKILVRPDLSGASFTDPITRHLVLCSSCPGITSQSSRTRGDRKGWGKKAHFESELSTVTRTENRDAARRGGRDLWPYYFFLIYYLRPNSAMNSLTETPKHLFPLSCYTLANLLALCLKCMKTAHLGHFSRSHSHYWDSCAHNKTLCFLFFFFFLLLICLRHWSSTVEDWRSMIKALADSVSGEVPLPVSEPVVFLLQSRMMERARDLFGVSVGRAGILFIMASPSWPHRVPKAPPPSITTTGIRFQHMYFGRMQTFSPKPHLSIALWYVVLLSCLFQGSDTRGLLKEFLTIGTSSWARRYHSHSGHMWQLIGSSRPFQ